MRIWPVALLVACNNDTTILESAQCDGVLQPGETSVDDAFDRDEDGYFDGTNPGCLETYPAESLDCDDAAEDVNPGGIEIECDGIDQDCDEATPDGLDDGGCAADDFSGTWNLDQAIAYTCAMGLVNVNFSTLTVVDGGDVMSIGTNSAAQPGTMQGTRQEDGTFSVTTSIAGSCTETYTMTGGFVGDEVDGTFTMGFSGSCFGCTLTTRTVSGTRQ